jgi:mannosyl-oligosaccharide alpha-1,2-mannosidase
VTKLGPEKMIFNQDGNPTHRASDKHYLLRPEVVESYYYLWKVTGDMKYRDWAWDAAQVSFFKLIIMHNHSFL